MPPPAEGHARRRAQALFERVAVRCDLPPLPAVAARAIALARDPDARTDDLARVVATDGTLAVQVLRIARSARYLRRQPPRTLPEAIATVGLDGLRRVLVAASVRQAYRVVDDVGRTLWTHALATALAADELGRLSGEPRGGDAFIAGLLHDVGRLIFHLADPGGYARLGHADPAAEEAHFGVTHAGVGGCLAERWGLDDAVVEAVLFHHEPIASRPASRIAEADRVAHELGFGSVGEELGAPEIVGTCERAAVAAQVAQILPAERSLFD
jgi:HD-like signal output (HDOD) protein